MNFLLESFKVVPVNAKKKPATAGIATIGINYKEQTKDWIDSGFVTFVGLDM